MVISNPQIRSSSLGLHRLSLVLVSGGHKASPRFASSSVPQQTSYQRGQMGGTSEPPTARQKQRSPRALRSRRTRPVLPLPHAVPPSHSLVLCFAHLLWYLASFSPTPSIPNYKSFQKCWRVKLSQSLTKIIERNTKIYDIK